LAVGKAEYRPALPFPVVDDGSPVRAALAGVVAGLRAANHELSVVLPVDWPRSGVDAVVVDCDPQQLVNVNTEPELRELSPP
jgi:molybdopterin-guanine dinucleotide biosynthesis protein A